MMIQKISSTEALALGKEKNTRWPNGRPSRLSPVCQVDVTSNFTFEPGAKVFTIGSCFARNIEKRFVEFGFDVPTRSWLNHCERLNAPNEFLNKYVARNILQELRWALDADHPFPEDGFLEITKGKWHDPHYTEIVEPSDIELVKERRAVATSITQEIVGADVVVITLGYVEAWRDLKSGLILNTFPSVRALKREPDRFELVVFSCSEILEDLDNIADLLKRYCKKNLKVLITVSPVPLIRTFRGGDIISNNSYSKSTQRAAVEEFVAKYDWVDYFPSYEIVEKSERSIAFGDDNRHVRDDIVSYIISKVIQGYVPNADFGFGTPDAFQAKLEVHDLFKSDTIGLSEIGEIYSKSKKLYESGSWATCAEFLQRVSPSNYVIYKDIPYLLSSSFLKLKQFSKAKIYADHSLEINDTWPVTYLIKAQAHIGLGQHEAAIAALEAGLEIDPNLDALLHLLKDVKNTEIRPNN